MNLKMNAQAMFDPREISEVVALMAVTAYVVADMSGTLPRSH
ncbi:MAG: hypothetical protein ABIS03_01150 [Gemmatimonadaceae bacterium]